MHPTVGLLKQRAITHYVDQVLKIRGIVFDKDGTLVDFYSTWMPAYEEAARLACEYAGQDHRGQDVLEATGMDPTTSRLRPGSPLACESNQRLARLWADILGIEDAAPMLRILESTFQTQGAARAVPVAGLRRSLQRLHSLGLLLGLTTMDSEALARETLRRLGVDQFFSFVCGYDSGYGEKPEPGMILGFCRSTSLHPAQCVMVGDTPHDLHMGATAGVAMKVGVLTGASDHVTLAGLADHVLPDIRGLEGVLELDAKK